MNPSYSRNATQSLVAEFGIGGLPPDVAERVRMALVSGASIDQTHEAARALAEECPPTCLQGVFFSLLVLSNPSIQFSCGDLNG